MALLTNTTFMQTPLHKLADIRTGHTFRGSIAESPTGNVRVMQIKDIKACTSVNEKSLPLIKWATDKAPKALQTGDIVMPARGEHYNAAIYKATQSNNRPVIATNQLFILRAHMNDNANSVTNEYLCWYLNQTLSQHYFKTHRSGTSIPMLNKYSLAALQIQLPPLEIQHKIVAMNAIWQQEKQLTEKLLDNREQMLNGIFQQLLLASND